tara:strand:+ start:26690 stop:27391 length:702 start_codon:yes stop_codon:yes gene_type:complete
MSINNETLGQSAEKVICDLNELDSSHLITRSNKFYENELHFLIKKALKDLPKIIKHAGLEKGSRGGQSKSPIDFYLEENKTLSIKTNKNANMKVCPSEVGQASWNVLNIHFKEILHINQIHSLNRDNFKKIVFNSIHNLMPIYLKHLMHCDYLLWIFQKKNEFNYEIFKKDNFKNIVWKLENFKFTKNLLTWNESCTVKYNDISIGEFQLHNNRSPNKKFRFNLKNLSKIMNL